ncbi:Hypothetical protein HVR_LOCUS983 [uncultured virus]|nr:Hypothetical protein HVR_LOCUS983 [uncultured virus]
MSLSYKFRTILFEKFAKLLIERNFTLFGSCVREYMCDRIFDHTTIDIFSGSSGFTELKAILTLSGFRIAEISILPKNNQYSYLIKDHGVYNFTIGLTNDELFVGEKIEFNINFINGYAISPSFGYLEFDCDAFIWDKYGIRLGSNTGTYLDKLSRRISKWKEMKILEDADKKITSYIPINEVLNASQGNDAWHFRRVRVKNIVRLIQAGWTIKNFNCIIEVKPMIHDICTICQEELVDKCIKLSCVCGCAYHHDCFIRFAQSALNDKTFITCPQRCREVYF